MISVQRVSHPVVGISLLIAAEISYSATSSFEISRIDTDFVSKEVQISGSNFGEGPQILLYDTFDSSISAAGAPLPKKASIVGEWSAFHQYNTPVFSDSGRSGQYSFKAFDGSTQKTNRIDFKFQGTQEFFVSYWVYLEGPDYFPGDFTTEPKTFPKDSSFKFLWVYDTDVKGDSSDVVLPTHVGYGKFYLAGNDANLVTDLGNNWWSWDHWMRLSFWLKADPQNPTAPGVIHFDTLSQDKGHEERVFNVPVFDEDGPAVKQYQQMNFPGWVRSIQNPSTNILYDDIYISTGPNAAARVELGNAADLSKVTRLELLKIESWSETGIRASAPTVNEDALRKLFLYITTSDGTTNEKGIPLLSPPAQIEAINVN